MTGDIRKYFIKESWRFNLESMNDKLWCIEYDVCDGLIQLPIEIAGTKIESVDDLYDLRNECQELLDRARYKVTGKEFGRIKALVSWRVEQRYFRCLEAGMSENDAGMCFEDL